MLCLVAFVALALISLTLTTAVLTLGVRNAAGLLIDVPLGWLRLMWGKLTGRDE